MEKTEILELRNKCILLEKENRKLKKYLLEIMHISSANISFLK